MKPTTTGFSRFGVYKYYFRNRAFFCSFAFVSIFFLLLQPSFSQGKAATADISETAAQFGLMITRNSGFLSDPAKEPLELFRRLGRFISRYSNNFNNDVLRLGGFYEQNLKDGDHSGGVSENLTQEEIAHPDKNFPLQRFLMKPFFSSEWTASQKTAFEKLFNGNLAIFSALEKDITVPVSGLFLKGIFDLSILAKSIENLLENSPSGSKLKPAQNFKFKDKILPFLKVAEIMAFSAAISSEGLKLSANIKGGSSFAEMYAKNGVLPSPITTAKYIDPQCLAAFSQIGDLSKAEDLIKDLREIPQTKIIENYLASAGLDFEKDILANTAVESLIAVNLEPTGEGGLPDIQIVAKVKDPVKLMTIVPGLKQLAMNLGVFVQVNSESVASIRVSYFLFPKFALHATLSGDLLIVATSKENLVKMAKRVEEVNSGKIPVYAFPEGCHRYWRIDFPKFNEQIQKLLQSPLLADKGIPPLTNLSITGELGELILVFKILSDRVDVKVTIPVKNSDK